MRILGVVGSARSMGNTEVLIKHALLMTQTKGAEVEMIRLTDLRIDPCRGCMLCVLKSAECPLSDDMDFLLRTLERADGMVLGAPVYFMGAPGIIKMIVDRFLMVKQGQYDGKKAVIIGVAGQAKWGRMFMPQLSLLPLAAGFEVVDAALLSSPGPGEVLLDGGNTHRVEELTYRLMASIGGQPRQLPLVGQQCPICFGTSFQLKTPTRVECPLCYTEGDIVVSNGGVTIRFDEETARFRFFGAETREDHMDNWVRKTGPRFRERLRDVLAARKPYENAPVPWIKPRRSS